MRRQGLSSSEDVERLARLALAGISREYPHKPGAVMRGPEDVAAPRVRHPVFYGCFDWHSAVHSHWMLVRLLRLHPEVGMLQGEVRAALTRSLRPEALEREAAFFDAPENHSFERTYGWAWLLCLARELHAWEDEQGAAWAHALSGLEQRIRELAVAYLPTLSLPIRSGEHSDTAFALAFFHDYARARGDEAFAALLTARARQWFEQDVDYPEAYEPSGHDFFSSGLNVADLMGRVLPSEAFPDWLQRFCPALATRSLARWATPAGVDDVTDGKLVHLAGLNLTRAWTMRGIAAALPEADPRRPYLEELATRHARAGFDLVFTGHYAGEHWLASFAVYLETQAWDQPG